MSVTGNNKPATNLSADTVGSAVLGARNGLAFPRLRFAVPMLVFAGLAIAFGWSLTREPGKVPSPLIGKLVPEFSLPPVKGRTLGLSSANLKGEVSLVNFFASWCAPCRAEHPLFVQLNAYGVVPIHGINYKDQPDHAARWLNTLGDPYTRTGADLDGRVGIEWGVYGLPETFVISKDGRIAHKHIAPLTPKSLEEDILPLIRRLQEQ
jgi:cytochrome c biogenesis protein CcmG/thiol:disulfide interchange protein DsbE